MGFQKLSDDDLDKVNGGVNINSAIDTVIASDYKSAASQVDVDLTGIRSASPVSSAVNKASSKASAISEKLAASSSSSKIDVKLRKG